MEAFSINILPFYGEKLHNDLALFSSGQLTGHFYTDLWHREIPIVTGQ
jgi:hypothetical protein